MDTKLIIRRTEEAIIAHILCLRDLEAITQTDVIEISARLRKAISDGE